MGAKLGIVSISELSLNLSKEPSTESLIVGSLMNGTAIQILDTIGFWHHIEVGSLNGYVPINSIFVQDEGFPDRMMNPLYPNFNTLSPFKKVIIKQALKMLGNEVVVFDGLPEEQQKDCYGWRHRKYPSHPNYKDIVCSDLVYICLKAAGVKTAWAITKPPNTRYNTSHAANYFRPSNILKEVNETENWEPGDILIYWNGNLNENRIKHVNLYVGPFAGMDIDGVHYPADDPCDVVDASLDTKCTKCNIRRGTRILGGKKDNYLDWEKNKLIEHYVRLRHVELV